MTRSQRARRRPAARSGRPAPASAAAASSRRCFPPRLLSLLGDSLALGIQAGTQPHRFTYIWFVMVDGRVFVRPWNDKRTGWYRTFLREPRGTILVYGREIPVLARKARGESLFDAVDAAYAAKYHTKASLKWVRGFSLPRRRETTTELLPAPARRAASSRRS